MCRDARVCRKKWELLSPGQAGRGVPQGTPQGFALPLMFFAVAPFLVSVLSLSKWSPLMDGPHSPVSTLSFPTGPLSSFADTWDTCPSGCPAKPCLKCIPNQECPGGIYVFLFSRTRFFRTVLSLCPFSCHVPSLTVAFPAMQVSWLCYLVGSYSCLCSETSNCGGVPSLSVYLIFYCVYHGMSHTYLVLNNGQMNETIF